MTWGLGMLFFTPALTPACSSF